MIPSGTGSSHKEQVPALFALPAHCGWKTNGRAKSTSRWAPQVSKTETLQFSSEFTLRVELWVRRDEPRPCVFLLRQGDEKLGFIHAHEAVSAGVGTPQIHFWSCLQLFHIATGLT